MTDGEALDTTGVLVLPACDHAEMKWANGGGITREVLRFPKTGDFDWRVSLADVDTDGPFSVLPGIDRCLILTDGTSIALVDSGASASGPPTTVDELTPFRFPGERPYECRLGHGPAKDLNVMTRRGRFESTVCVLRAGEHGIDAANASAVHILVALRGTTVVAGHTLGYRDAAVVRGGHFLVTTEGAFVHIAICVAAKP